VRLRERSIWPGFAALLSDCVSRFIQLPTERLQKLLEIIVNVGWPAVHKGRDVSQEANQATPLVVWVIHGDAGGPALLIQGLEADILTNSSDLGSNV